MVMKFLENWRDAKFTLDRLIVQRTRCIEDHIKPVIRDNPDPHRVSCWNKRRTN